MSTIRPLLLALSLLLPQTTPSGGAIAKYVPPLPTPASFVSDVRNVLSPSAHRVIDGRITSIQNAGLGDIAVAILPSIGDYSPNQVSVEIYRTWKVGSMATIGSAHRDVGLLILIVPKELAPNHQGQCWITPGTGAEGIITDASAGTVCRDSIIPHLRNKDYDGAVLAGVLGLEAKLRGDVGLTAAGSAKQIVSPTEKRSSSGSIVLGVLFAGILVIVLGITGLSRWIRYRPRKCPHCGRMMRRLDEAADDAKLDPGQQLEEKLKSVDYDVWVCQCGNSLILPHAGWFSSYSKCRKCGRKTASHTRTELIPATTMSAGAAEDRFVCKNCGETWAQKIILPRIVPVSSSSGGGSSGFSGGGGGSSFGGSGSTSGGGGGGSY
jgi:uncharacterized protein